MENCLYFWVVLKEVGGLSPVTFRRPVAPQLWSPVRVWHKRSLKGIADKKVYCWTWKGWTLCKLSLKLCACFSGCPEREQIQSYLMGSCFGYLSVVSGLRVLRHVVIFCSFFRVFLLFYARKRYYLLCRKTILAMLFCCWQFVSTFTVKCNVLVVWCVSKRHSV